MSPKDQGTIMALIDLQKNNIGLEELQETFGQMQKVLTMVVQYSQPILEV